MGKASSITKPSQDEGAAQEKDPHVSHSSPEGIIFDLHELCREQRN